MNRLPSLTALRAFDLVVRHGSLTQAAAILNVTRPAVSKQIKLLETELGCQLLLRSGPRVSLTVAGQELATGVQQGFDLLQASSRRTYEAAYRPESVRLLVDRDFAASWLAERIGEFLVHHPGISLEITAEKNGTMRAEEDFSFRIFYGQPGGFAQRGLVEIALSDWVDIPLCSPDYAQTRLANVAAAKGLRFLLDRNYDPWQVWFERTGTHPLQDEAAYTRFNDTSLCLSAALSGGGLTIGDSFLCLDALIDGTLVAPFKKGLRSTEQYSLCHPVGRQLTKAEQAFQTWLLAAVQAYDLQVEKALTELEIQVISQQET